MSNTQKRQKYGWHWLVHGDKLNEQPLVKMDGEVHQEKFNKKNLSGTWPLNSLIPFSRVILNLDYEIGVNFVDQPEDGQYP